MPNKQSQKEIWDSIAQSWNKYKITYPDFIKNFLEKNKGLILDMGCGSGRNFPAIKGEVYAVDFSPEMLKYAKEKAKKLKLKAEFFESSASKLPFKDNLFDAAIYIAALHCVDNENDREKSLNELFRVLKPGARALISVWSKGNKVIHGRTGEIIVTWKRENKRIERYYYIYERDELEALLKSRRFKILKIKENDNIIAIVQKPKR